ncbi:MAG: hypothetical protein AB1490_24930 [Pseudomonadota bacterium]
MVGTATRAAANAASSKRRDFLLRVPLAIVGGYGAASALVSGLALSLPLLGMTRSDAVVTASMLGFLIYLVLLLWGAAARRLMRLAIGYAILTAIGMAPWALLRAGG